MRGDVQADFRQAADDFVEAVAGLPQGTIWGGPGLGIWTVRDLVGHTSRALATVADYLLRPADEETVSSSTAYFLMMREQADHAAVAARGRAAGAALGADPASAVAALRERVISSLAVADEDTLVTTPAGGMRLSAYLPTRTFELVVHTLDLAAATDTAPTISQAPLRAALSLATDLAFAQGVAPQVLRMLTGRPNAAQQLSVI